MASVSNQRLHHPHLQFRHGSHVYKTVNEKTCCPVFTIRCDTEHFRISKTQKRVQMKGETPNDSKKSQDVCGGD
ncbi:Arginyl-tRNA--protein transferase 1 [Taenia solium]|eukprot:TsM_000291200 transcript=TsM_000291200 gene=TsM_000291200